MPLAEASALTESEKPVIIEHDPEADRAALEHLADRCEQFSPIVGLAATEQPASLLFDVTGIGTLFDGEGKLASDVATDFQRRGYFPRIAVADTIGAAWAVAHFGEEPTAVISNGDHLENLSSLPIESLRLSDHTVDLLHQLGIVEMRQLLDLPRASLPSRFGDELLQRLDQATGEADEIIVPHRAAPKFAAALDLEHPTAHRETVTHIVGQLVDEVARRLSQADQGAIELICRFANSGQPLEIRVGLFEPTAAPQHLLGLLQMQLEHLALQGAVHQICLSATITAPLTQKQGELFDGAANQPRQLAHLVDRLSSRLGRQRVVRPRLQPAALPEREYRYESMAGRPVRRREQAKTFDSAPLQRPLQLKFPPAPLKVVTAIKGGPPAMFQWQNQRHEVARTWGPERIETEWWRGETVRRDYYRVETVSGKRFWLFRRLQDGSWFLHGEFA